MWTSEKVFPASSYKLRCAKYTAFLRGQELSSCYQGFSSYPVDIVQ
ncbi:hypothetical protein [Sulfolobus acidocaldarius]|nr:hypothetical protein [Sulfolobus acidocaldarius]WCM35813.1 hypothetical protein GO597_10980 [Sulfolobus acidocaldarius DSM 639]